MPVGAQKENAAAQMAQLINQSNYLPFVEATAAVHRLRLTSDHLEAQLSHLVQHATAAQNKTVHLQQLMKIKLVKSEQFAKLGSLQETWANEALVLEKQRRAAAQRNESASPAPAIEQIKLDLLGAASSLDQITAGVAKMASDSRHTEWAAESIHTKASMQREASSDWGQAQTAEAKNLIHQASWRAEAELVRQAMLIEQQVQARKKAELQSLRKQAAAADRLKHRAQQAWQESQLRLTSLRATLVSEEAELQRHQQSAAAEKEQMEQDSELRVQLESTLNSATENSTAVNTKSRFCELIACGCCRRQPQWSQPRKQ